MRAELKRTGNPWNNDEAVSSPAVAPCHAEEPEGTWFDLGFPKHRYGLTDHSFGGLITSNCSVPHRSTFLKISTIW